MLSSSADPNYVLNEYKDFYLWPRKVNQLGALSLPIRMPNFRFRTVWGLSRSRHDTTYGDTTGCVDIDMKPLYPPVLLMREIWYFYASVRCKPTRGESSLPKIDLLLWSVCETAQLLVPVPFWRMGQGWFDWLVRWPQEWVAGGVFDVCLFLFVFLTSFYPIASARRHVLRSPPCI